MAQFTMKHLAESLGLNPATVSRALDPDKSHLVAEATRLRVIRAAEEVGYTPDPAAASTRRRRSSTVGILVPDLANEAIVNVLRAVGDVLERNDLTALIAESADSPERSRRTLERCRARRVEAIISLAATEADAELMASLARTIPTVLAIRTLDSVKLPTVCCDDVRGAALVADHLADLGHTRLIQLMGPPEAATFRNRARGFETAAGLRGVMSAPTLFAAHATAAEGRRLGEQLFSGPRDQLPTAVFAHNDSMALGLVEAARVAGLRVPHDLSVVGYNDTTMARDFSLPLTTVRYPAQDVGTQAGVLAVSLIQGGTAPKKPFVFPPQLVVRESTARPRSR
ncbi:DNA-binding transcriptional regulator CytR [Acrocarpospora pleiomorpha]|uniref:DNA-binding transcriptional regulator CytR n=1 Tax=Acrocarpospora pleiomorpha TaxID=90975 RepID=A0A5M3XFR5_9ACTN|nr:DNA-binding transcriptional regulator CytR [Acrocarpospora pleiomorpha]